ncbi:MAG: hypothetical protein ACLSFO_05900, partial [Anaerovoracaceae bacterium]
ILRSLPIVPVRPRSPAPTLGVCFDGDIFKGSTEYNIIWLMKLYDAWHCGDAEAGADDDAG